MSNEGDFPRNKSIARSRLARLAQENIELREALKFYGERKHWAEQVHESGKIGYHVRSELHADGGKIARKARGEE